MPKRTSLTPYQRHKQQWSKCQLCDLHQSRRNVVLYRGHIPCEILFIGEAPGLNEDSLGKPFIGKAGKHLDYIISQAGADKRTIGWTNVIACIPKDEEGDKVSEPPIEAIKACAPRLSEIIDIAKPTLVVRVGRHSEAFVNPTRDCYLLDLPHPAWILRRPLVFQDIETHRCVVSLSDKLEEIWQST